MFCIGALEDFLQHTFCVSLLKISYIKSHVIPSFKSIVLLKILLNPFPLMGGSGLVIFEMHTLFSHIRLSSKNSH